MPARSDTGISRQGKAICLLACGWLSLMAALPASAETLEQVLAGAYANNPRLRGEQARLRASDETLAQAQSGYRPTISSEFDFTSQSTHTNPSSPTDGVTHPRTETITATQPLFDGFQTLNNVKAADANIRAERENLRAIEEQVMLDSITAYMDVVRDRNILKARDQNVTTLNEELRSVRARFNVGEVTRTDVEQARATLAAAQSADALAKGNLRNSTARFILATGQTPHTLVEPQPPRHLVPASVDEAISAAEEARPTVIMAAYLEKAQRSTIRSLTGQLLPKFEFDASATETDAVSSTVKETEITRYTGKLTIPIYESGSVRAQIRQAKETRQGLLENIEQAREQAASDATTAWSLLQTAKAQLEADTIQVESAQTALQGVRAELQVGQRTELDVLNAVQTLLNAQVSVVSDKHDIVVNSYTVLATMGRLTADQLRLGTALYDVERHYNDTNGKWFDIRISREEGYAGYDVGVGRQ
jgi:outer membrane protein